jgi:hypothetical protein
MISVSPGAAGADAMMLQTRFYHRGKNKKAIKLDLFVFENILSYFESTK